MTNCARECPICACVSRPAKPNFKRSPINRRNALLVFASAETVADFLSRLRSSAGTLNVPERQRVVRLLVKEIFVGDDKIVIRHSIPLPANPPGGPYPNGDSPGPGQDQSGSYLLRSGRNDRALRRPLHRLDLSVLFKHPSRQPFADQADDPPIADPMLNKPYQPCMADRVEGSGHRLPIIVMFRIR